jgi:hypothetical protein
MKSARLILLAAMIAIVPACGSEEPTPRMVGSEALKNLPEGPTIKPDVRSKSIRAEGPAGGSGGTSGTDIAAPK